jgi:hypothetical protein
VRSYNQVAVWLSGCLLMVLHIASAAEVTPKKAAPASKAAPPDAKFLEYLGTFEGDNENWTQVDLPVIAATALPPTEGKAGAKVEATAKPAAERK